MSVLIANTTDTVSFTLDRRVEETWTPAENTEVWIADICMGEPMKVTWSNTPKFFRLFYLGLIFKSAEAAEDQIKIVERLTLFVKD